MDPLKNIQNQLFIAIKQCCFDYGDEVKRILSDHPVLINLKRTDDFLQEVSTPLIEASRQGLYGVVEILLNKGADVSGTGNIHPYSSPRGVITPLDMVSSGAQFGALDDVFPLFAVAAFIFCGNKWVNEKIIKALLSAGADVNQRTAIGLTALHVICAYPDGGAQATEFSLDDDDYSLARKYSTMGPIEILLDHGADVNMCDHHGKSPLHYAAQNGNKYFVKILLKKGANVYLKDKVGLTALEYAATEDKLLTIALIDKYSFPMEQVIKAYECVALNNPYCYSIDSEMLQKATLLRELHGIPKTILPPLECYGYKKEWQTTEELEEYGDDFSQLLRQCLLARERLCREIHFDVAPTKQARNLDSRGGILKNKKLLNSRMRYWLDRISYFGNHLHFAELMIKGDISLKSAMDYQWSLSNDVLLRFVLVAIDSCCVIQNRLNSETKPGCIQELVSTMEQIVAFIGGVILHLIKRNDRNSHHKQDNKNKVSQGIAKILLNELLHRCPKVSSPFNGYASPVTNILFKAKHKDLLYERFTFRFFRYNYQLAKMIAESCQCDLNATDCNGNTILHIVIFDFLLEVEKFFHYTPDRIDALMIVTKEIVRILLEKGSYPHARNKQGKCPGDVPHDVKFDNISPETYVIPFKDLLKKHDCSLTLKYLAATKIVDSKIYYKNHLEYQLEKFVDLHTTAEPSANKFPASQTQPMAIQKNDVQMRKPLLCGCVLS